MLPQDATKLFKFYNRDTIKELIDESNLPDFMDGTCTDDYRTVPAGCKTAEELGESELGLTADQVGKVKKHFAKYLTSDENRNEIN